MPCVSAPFYPSDVPQAPQRSLCSLGEAGTRLEGRALGEESGPLDLVLRQLAAPQEPLWGLHPACADTWLRAFHAFAHLIIPTLSFLESLTRS